MIIMMLIMLMMTMMLMMNRTDGNQDDDDGSGQKLKWWLTSFGICSRVAIQLTLGKPADITTTPHTINSNDAITV